VTPRRLYWALLGAVLVLSGVIVAMAFNPIPHPGGDNAGYVSLAHGLVTTGTYTDVFDPEGLPHTKYPPVFPAVLALLIGLGARTWVALKMTAAVSTVAAIGFTYAWAERSIGSLPAFAVALVLALSSGIVYYSHWILSDPLFLVLTVAALLALARADEDGAQPLWLVAGVLAAGLAYFTRSAGLPLIVALLLWLGLRRRWRALAMTTVAVGLPMIGWWLRGRGEGVAQYGAEFWMVDPYQPTLGTIGVFGLVPRLFGNLSSYAVNHLPGGVVGTGGPALTQLGLLLTLSSLAGWVLCVRKRVGPAELFFPLYAGLILLWPEVWGGDRFALPLYPLVFLYGAVALREVTSRLPAVAGPLMTAAAVLVLLLPAAGNWIDGAREASACERIVGERGAWGCYGPQIGSFVGAAAWTGSGLPRGAAVLSRKPRHFYLLSGHPSRAFPFDEDPATHLALADELGARYVLLDRWDGLASRYVGAAVRRRPGAFCFVRGFGDPAQGGAQLLGILPPAQRSPLVPDAETGVRLSTCPAEYSVGAESGAAYTSSGRIPLLERLAS